MLDYEEVSVHEPPMATWCTGVRTPPLAAHAWVEAQGRKVGEPTEDTDYTPIVVVHPSYDV